MDTVSATALTAALAAVNAVPETPLALSQGKNSLVICGSGIRPWRLSIDFRIPLTEMPLIFLVPASAGVGFGHVSHSGEVCYSDHEGEGFDPENWENVIAHAVERAIAVLDSSFQKAEQGDFKDLENEFEGYWGTLPGCRLVPLTVQPSTEHLYARFDPNQGKAKKHREMVLLGIDNGASSSLNGTRRKAHYFALASAILPPANGEPLGDTWIKNAIHTAGSTALRISQQQGHHILLFSQPRPTGEALFGITFKTVIVGRGFRFDQIKPFAVQRAWRNYLLARTGTESTAQRVAVIGCGSVGSRVAEQLSLGGIDELILIDDEPLSYDNIYRHLLGSPSVGRSKVEALKQELVSKRTGLVVQTFLGNAEEWLQDPRRREGCDTIVLTTGKPAIERHIVRLAHSERWPQRLVSGWLEPLGLGGHVMSSQTGVKGCLECLYTDVGGSRPDMRVAFLKSGQAVSRNLTGCGGGFMPYTALNAIETALLISKVVIEGATGYRCWVGDPSAALAEGLEVTSWHTRCLQGLRANDADVIHSDCPCCNS